MRPAAKLLYKKIPAHVMECLMSGRLILILIAVAAVGYYFYLRDPLVGEWQSDAALTMSELESADVSALAKRRLAKVFGRMRLEITDTEWNSTLDGVTQRGSYTVLSSDGDCFDIEFSPSDANAEKQRTTVCLKDGNLHIPILKVGAAEVFRRI